MSTATTKHTRCQRRRARCAALVACLATALAMMGRARCEAQQFAQFWITGSANVQTGSTPPATMDALPQISSLPGAAGSFYLWGRPATGMTLQNWSLDVVSSNTSIVRFTPGDVINPQLGSQAGTPLHRWEWDAPGRVDGNGAMLTGIKGFSLLGSARRGIGIGQQAATLNDPNYSAGTNAWLLAKINFVSSAPEGTADISLRIGSEGFNHTGESTVAGSAKLGASSNAPMSGATRLEASKTLVARVGLDPNAGIAADFTADGVVDGADFLRWQRNVGVQAGATRAQGDADGDGAVGAADLVTWKSMFRTPGADFDGDGDADGADFLSWQQGVNATSDVSLAHGDANGDRNIDGADLTMWKQTFPAAAAVAQGEGATASRAVPEPAGWLAIINCVSPLALIIRRRLRRATIRARMACDRYRAAAAVVAATVVMSLLPTAHAQTNDIWQFTSKLLHPDTTAGDLFGRSVAMGGQYSAIGAIGAAGPGGSTGNAYGYINDPLAYLWQFSPADGSAGDEFGGAVAVNDGYTLMGANRQDDGGTDAGAAYLFDNSSGQYLRTLFANDGGSSNRFGYSVGVSFDYAVVGAPDHSHNAAFGTGGAYVFDATTGQQLHELQADDATPLDALGQSLAVSNIYAVAGAVGRNSYAGKAYMFDITTGAQVQQFTANDGSANDLFGASVAISGDYVLIGAPGAENGGSDRGAAYLFDWRSGAQIWKFSASDGLSFDNFGQSVAISGTRALIGAPHHDAAGADAGAAYVFDIATGQQVDKLLAPDAVAQAKFGTSIAVAGGRTIIGAEGDSERGVNAGAAYVFQKTSLWNTFASGPWSTGPWSGGVPNSESDHALIEFGMNPPGPITLDVDVTLNRLKFGQNTTNHEVAGPNALTLSLDFETGTGPAIEIATGINTVSAPIRGNWGLTKMGAGTLIVSGAKQYAGLNTQFNVDGSRETYASTTRVEEGRLVVEGAALPAGLIALFPGSQIEFRGYSTYTLTAGTRLHGYQSPGFGAPATDVLVTHQTLPTQLIVGEGARLTGGLDITAGRVVNQGRVAPGSSPGIITILGDYQQSATGTLEIEVGGVGTAGVDFDQLQVSGAATLAGRFEVPIINGFIPANGSTAPFLTAGSRTGEFATIVAPNLPVSKAVNVTYGANGASIVFRDSEDVIELQAFNNVQPWDSLNTWENVGADRVPDFYDNLTITTGATAQTVNLASGTERVNGLSISGGAGALTIVVGDDALANANLVATRLASIGNNSVIAIKEGAMLSTPTLTVASGGLLQGRGTVAGDLVVGAAVGAAGVVSPGFSVGTLKVVGDYEQNATGELKIEIDSETSFDKLQIAGEANLGGKLTLDPNGFTAGVPMEIVTADSLGTGTFATVDVLGGGNRHASLIYQEETATTKAAVLASIVIPGDANFDGVANVDDAEELARFFQNSKAWEAHWLGQRRNPDNIAADVKTDGRRDFDDVVRFAELYGAEAAARFTAAYNAFAAPEPGAGTLAAAAFVSLVAARRRAAQWPIGAGPRSLS